MKKQTFSIISAAIASFLLCAASDAFERRDSIPVEKVYTDEFLDTVNVGRKFLMNDYTSIGFHWGFSMSRAMFNPPKSGQSMLLSPRNFGVSFSKYCKMFGYMPYFGIQTGLFYGEDGFSMREYKKTENGVETTGRETVDGAYETTYEYLEVPLLALFHVDSGNFRVEANIGPYGGYRKSVTRKGDETMDAEYAGKFHDYDRRADYGIKGGLGFALIFDPVEFHIGGQVRYAFSSLYEPDYFSEDFYRYAYPFDIIISAGVQFQLTKRSGKTRAALRREAKELVTGGNRK